MMTMIMWDGGQWQANSSSLYACQEMVGATERQPQNELKDESKAREAVEKRTLGKKRQTLSVRVE